MKSKVNKRSLENSENRIKFFEMIDSKIAQAEKKSKTDKRFKSDAVKRLQVVKIVYLLQSFGMRINEAVKLDKSKLKDIQEKSSLTYLISKTKQNESVKFRTIEFADYDGYQDEFKLLQKLVSEFIFDYKGGLFSGAEKKEIYEQKVTERILNKRVVALEKQLDKVLTPKKERNQRIREFKKLEENQIGYVFYEVPKYIIRFTEFFNRQLKECFGTFVKDSDKVKINRKTGKLSEKTDSELKNAKQTKIYTSHSLRAGFVVSQFKAGRSLEEIQSDIKHNDINQTNAYLVDIDKKRKPIARAESNPNPKDDVESKDEVNVIEVETIIGGKMKISYSSSENLIMQMEKLKALKIIK
jgi:site-specific recombinase XerD